MTNDLDTKLSQLKELEIKLENLTNLKEKIRNEIFKIVEEENLNQYKNEVATISKVERKTIKFVKDKEEILKELEKNKLVKYFDVIPEEIIAEHKELNKNFDKDIKEGKYKIDGIEVDTKTFPAIRFN